MNVPQLRFSGFDGEWDTSELKKLVKLEGGATPLKSEKRYWQNGHTPWVSSQEVGPKKLDKTTFNITDAAVSETSTKMVDKDTLLLVVRSGILARKIPLSITAVPMAINQDIKAMIIKDKRLHHLFLYQWMKKSEKAMLSNVVKGGTTVQSVNTPDLQDYLIRIPSINEQYKIAEFFELIDGKIEKLQEKIGKLEKFKKGMMQKMFSQELRFKDENGGEFPEWEEKTLRSLITTKRKGAEAVYSENGNILLHNDYLEFEANIKYVKNEKNVSERDILILWDGSQAGNIYTNRTGVLGSTFVAISINENYESYYIYHFLISNLSLIKIAWREGSGVPHVSKDFINNFSIKLPKSKLEQEKIANFLFVLDEKLAKEKEKLMVLEEQKRGFMQGMFV